MTKRHSPALSAIVDARSVLAGAETLRRNKSWPGRAMWSAGEDHMRGVVEHKTRAVGRKGLLPGATGGCRGVAVRAFAQRGACVRTYFG